MNEKRGTKRTPIELAASYGVPELEMEAQESLLLDVSKGGFCISSTKDIKVGTRLILQIEASPQKQVETTVKVVWSQLADGGIHYLIGVQLIDVDEDKALEIHRICSE